MAARLGARRSGALDKARLPALGLAGLKMRSEPLPYGTLAGDFPLTRQRFPAPPPGTGRSPAPSLSSGLLLTAAALGGALPRPLCRDAVEPRRPRTSSAWVAS
jgi:hypothetical protein